jgi:hypothetical protein
MWQPLKGKDTGSPVNAPSWAHQGSGLEMQADRAGRPGAELPGDTPAIPADKLMIVR